MTKKFLGLFLRIGVSVGTVVLVLYFQREHLDEAMMVLRHHIQWEYFLLALAAYIGALAVISVRLKYVFFVQRIKLSFRETFYLTWVGLFFNLFLPSAVGGDIAKAYYASKHSHKKIPSMMAVVWDRLLGFITLITMALVAILVFHDEINNTRVDELVFGFLIFFLVLTLVLVSKRFARLFGFLKSVIPSKKIHDMFREMHQATYTFKGHKKILAGTLGLSLCGQALFIIIHYWLTCSMGISMNPWLFFVLIPLLSIITMIPSIGGLGIREAGVVYLFKSYMPEERALALSLLLDMLIYGLSFAAGLLFAFKGGLKAKVIHEMEAMNESQ